MDDDCGAGRIIDKPGDPDWEAPCPRPSTTTLVIFANVGDPDVPQGGHLYVRLCDHHIDAMPRDMFMALGEMGLN